MQVTMTLSTPREQGNGVTEWCEYTIAVPREAIDAPDWRDDTRWDQIIELADSLYPGHQLVHVATLTEDSDD
jgi:hypothetical protein